MFNTPTFNITTTALISKPLKILEFPIFKCSRVIRRMFLLMLHSRSKRLFWFLLTVSPMMCSASGPSIYSLSFFVFTLFSSALLFSLLGNNFTYLSSSSLHLSMVPKILSIMVLNFASIEALNTSQYTKSDLSHHESLIVFIDAFLKLSTHSNNSL